VVPVTPPRSQSLLIISTIVMVVPLLVPHQVKNCKISPLEHAYVQTIQNVPGFCIRWNRIRFHIRTYILTVCTHQKFFFLKDKRKKKNNNSISGESLFNISSKSQAPYSSSVNEGTWRED
jgi:hypothetical protein